MNDSNNGSKYGGLLYDDIADAHSLAIKLHERATPLCVDLMEKFSEPARDAIDNYGASPADAEKLKPVLAEELRQIIKGGLIYDPGRFPDDGLRPITKAVLLQQPRGLDQAWANRLLLRDAFRAELSCASATLVAEWAPEGIQCRVHCEARQLTRRVGLSYKIAFSGLGKRNSRHVESLDKAWTTALIKANGIVVEIHTATLALLKNEGQGA